jgi:hypothetical protein
LNRIIGALPQLSFGWHIAFIKIPVNQAQTENSAKPAKQQLERRALLGTWQWQESEARA